MAPVYPSAGPCVLLRVANKSTAWRFDAWPMLGFVVYVHVHSRCPRAVQAHRRQRSP